MEFDHDFDITFTLDEKAQNNTVIVSANCSMDDGSIDIWPYIDMIVNFSKCDVPTIFMLQGLNYDAILTLKLYFNNIYWNQIYGIHKEIHGTKRRYTHDMRDTFIATIWSHHFELAYAVVPSYISEQPKLGRRTSDLLYLQMGKQTILACNVWLPPSKKMQANQKSVAILDSIFGDIKRVSADSVAICGTFNAEPNMLANNFIEMPLGATHIQMDVATKKYQHNKVGLRVDYGLFSADISPIEIIWPFAEDAHSIVINHISLN